MTYHNEWRPRLSIEIDEEEFKKLQKLIPWGVKNQLFKIIIDDLIKALEKNGPMVLGAILSGKVRLVYNEEGKESKDGNN
jgi:predicted GNAT superfamily acetyltransferase|tara:strand:- start:635 stop:874 length:240 start_codon:yes stop_codon:yes gene_type:complete